MQSLLATRTCTHCNTQKPLTHYHRKTKGSSRLRTQCKDCERDKNREWLVANPEKAALYKIRKRRPYDSAEERRRTYGISAADYDRLLVAQGGVCAICGGNNLAKNRNTLDVDHCHDSGKVRGLLCGRCNRAIGLFRDDSALCVAAAEYLRVHSS